MADGNNPTNTGATGSSAAPARRSAAEVLFGGSSSPQKPPVAPAAAASAQQPAPQPGQGAQPEKATEPGKAAEPEKSAAAGLYGEIPDDGVRYDEPVPVSAAELDIAPPRDMEVTDAPQLELVKEAMVAAGVGQTMKSALVQLAVPYLRTGEPVTLSEADARAQLQAKFGAKTDEKIAAARAMVADAAKKWPGVTLFLNESGLGNSPELIQKLAARAARRPDRRR